MPGQATALLTGFAHEGSVIRIRVAFRRQAQRSAIAADQARARRIAPRFNTHPLSERYFLLAGGMIAFMRRYSTICP